MIFIRMTDGSGEWRQLLFDMQEIVDWLVRAGQELASQQPVGSDISTVQHQNDNHQVRIDTFKKHTSFFFSSSFSIN